MQPFDKFHTSAHALDARNLTVGIRLFVIFKLSIMPCFLQSNFTFMDLFLKMTLSPNGGDHPGFLIFD